MTLRIFSAYSSRVGSEIACASTAGGSFAICSSWAGSWIARRICAPNSLASFINILDSTPSKVAKEDTILSLRLSTGPRRTESESRLTSMGSKSFNNRCNWSLVSYEMSLKRVGGRIAWVSTACESIAICSS